MSQLNYPDNTHYRLPRKNVFVLSCMDLRLLDNLLLFLHHDNLANRYDHFVLAGASLSASNQNHFLFKKDILEKYNDFEHWKKNLSEHIQLAIDLHDIRDVYIVEHQDCGAYHYFVDRSDLALILEEKEYQYKSSKQLADTISYKQYKKVKITDKQETIEEYYNLNVHCFHIDLRGNVELMYTTASS